MDCTMQPYPIHQIRYDRLLLWHALKSLIYRTEPTDATQLCIDYFDSTNPIYTSVTLQGWRSIVMKACLSVYLSVCLRAYTRNFIFFCMFFWWRCDTCYWLSRILDNDDDRRRDKMSFSCKGCRPPAIHHCLVEPEIQ